jgi:four helix bundle protein
MTATLKNFQFYKECKQVKLPHAMRDQLPRAASSITLNLAEGAAKPSRKERLRYYSIAFGSIREIQAIIRLEDLKQLTPTSEQMAAMLYKLAHQS